MEGPGDERAKPGKSAREDSHHTTGLTWNLKHDTETLSVKQKQTHRHTEQPGGCQEVGAEGGESAVWT